MRHPQAATPTTHSPCPPPRPSPRTRTALARSCLAAHHLPRTSPRSSTAVAGAQVPSTRPLAARSLRTTRTTACADATAPPRRAVSATSTGMPLSLLTRRRTSAATANATKAGLPYDVYPMKIYRKLSLGFLPDKSRAIPTSLRQTRHSVDGEHGQSSQISVFGRDLRAWLLNILSASIVSTRRSPSS